MVSAGRPPRFPALPFIRFQWDQASVSGTFIQYNVLRRIAGETSYTRIATITSLAQVSYRDYAVTSGTVYQYAVTNTQVIGGSQIDSATPTPVTISLTFNWAYLHVVGAEQTYVPLYSLDITEDIVQDVQQRAAWGRDRPTLFFGDLDYSKLKINVLPDVFNGPIWDALRPMLSLQPDSASLFCLRLGAAGEKYFVNIDHSSRRIGQAQYDGDISLVQVNYDEAV